VTLGNFGPNDPSVGKAPNVGNASYPRRLTLMRVRPLTMRSLWREDLRMLKKTQSEV